MFSETLRKYPPLVTLNRVVTRSYVLPGTKIKLKPGTKIIIPVYGLHYDPKFFKNPYTFDPERFSEENVHNLVPNTYIPFGEGPRFCIGKIVLYCYRVHVFYLFRFNWYPSICSILKSFNAETELSLDYCSFCLVKTTIWLRAQNTKMAFGNLNLKRNIFIYMLINLYNRVTLFFENLHAIGVSSG